MEDCVSWPPRSNDHFLNHIVSILYERGLQVEPSIPCNIWKSESNLKGFNHLCPRYLTHSIYLLLTPGQWCPRIALGLGLVTLLTIYLSVCGLLLVTPQLPEVSKPCWPSTYPSINLSVTNSWYPRAALNMTTLMTIYLSISLSVLSIYLTLGIQELPWVWPPCWPSPASLPASALTPLKCPMLRYVSDKQFSLQKANTI